MWDRVGAADTHSVELALGRQRFWTWRQVAAAVAVAAIGIDAVYPAAVALDVIPLGAYQYEEPAGQTIISPAGTLGWLAAIVVCLASIHHPRAISLLTRSLLPIAIASWLVAFYYSYDSYCAPGRCRISEASGVSAWVIVVPLTIAVVVVALAVVVPRTAMAMTAGCFVAFPIIAFFIGPWH
jgi:hypothetical protein